MWADVDSDRDSHLAPLLARCQPKLLAAWLGGCEEGQMFGSFGLGGLKRKCPRHTTSCTAKLCSADSCAGGGAGRGALLAQHSLANMLGVVSRAVADGAVPTAPGMGGVASGLLGKVLQALGGTTSARRWSWLIRQSW